MKIILHAIQYIRINELDSDVCKYCFNDKLTANNRDFQLILISGQPGLGKYPLFKFYLKKELLLL